MKQEESYIEPSAFFFDTYAFFEITKNNENYIPYISTKIATSKLNIFELYHGFLKNNNEELANILLDKYYQFVIDFDERVIKEAAKMKRELNKRDLSMTDCIGYVMAKQFGIKFLTGDKQFKDMDNVDFVV